MRGLSQQFHNVRLSTDLITQLAAQLESLAVSSAPADGAPLDVRGGVVSFNNGDRQYALHEPYSQYSYGGPMSSTELAAWFTEKAPSAVDAYLYSSEPRLVIRFQGGMEYGWITVESHPVMGAELDSEVVETALDSIAQVIKGHTTFFDEDPRGNRVFLGHGHGSDWKMIQKAIEDAGFDVSAFETVSAAGVVNIHAVDATIRGSFAAVLHMTPDDQMADGTRRARQNVIHEIGLAQGALQVTSVVVVHNEDAIMPSNLDGVTVVKYRSNGLYDKLPEVVNYLRQIKASPAYGHGDGVH